MTLEVEPQSFFRDGWLRESELVFFEYKELERSLVVIVLVNSALSRSRDEDPRIEYRFLKFCGVSSYRRTSCNLVSFRDVERFSKEDGGVPAVALYGEMSQPQNGNHYLHFTAGSFGEVSLKYSTLETATICYAKSGVKYIPEALKFSIDENRYKTHPFFGLV